MVGERASCDGADSPQEDVMATTSKNSTGTTGRSTRGARSVASAKATGRAATSKRVLMAPIVKSKVGADRLRTIVGELRGTAKSPR